MKLIQLKNTTLVASFIANGKAYGYDGDKLREYVEERLAEVVARDERAQKREMEKREVEESKREEEIEKLRQQLREQQGLRRSDAECDRTLIPVFTIIIV